MKICICVVWLIIHFAVYTRAEAFGELKEPCYTSTVYCTSVYTQGALLEFNGNLEAFVKAECENKDKCSFTVDSAWQSSCNNKEYNVVYLDVEYGCKGNTTSWSTTPHVSTTRMITTTTRTTTRTQPIYTGSFSSSTTTTSRTTEEGSANTTSASVARPPSSEMVSSGTNEADVDGKEDPIPLWYAIAGVLVVLFIISLVLVAVCVKRKRRRQNVTSTEEEHFSESTRNRIDISITNGTVPSGHKQATLRSTESIRSDGSDSMLSEDTSDISYSHTTRDIQHKTEDITSEINCYATTIDIQHKTENIASEINCYSTTRDIQHKTEEKTPNNQSDIATHYKMDSSNDVYAVVQKDQKKKTNNNTEDTENTDLLENALYASATN